MLLWLLFLILEIGLVWYALVDLSRQPITTGLKIVWVLVILAFPIIGSIASLIVNRAASRTA